MKKRQRFYEQVIRLKKILRERGTTPNSFTIFVGTHCPGTSNEAAAAIAELLRERNEAGTNSDESKILYKTV